MQTISCPRCGAETPNPPGLIVIEFCKKCGGALSQTELGPQYSEGPNRGAIVAVAIGVGIFVFGAIFGIGAGVLGASVGSAVADGNLRRRGLNKCDNCDHVSNLHARNRCSFRLATAEQCSCTGFYEDTDMPELDP